MTQEDVAAFLLMAEKTLSNWRIGPEPKGPKFSRFGNRIRYRRSDVLAWAESQGHDVEVRPPAAAKKKSVGQAERKAALAAIAGERDTLWQRLAALNAEEEALG